MERSPPARRQGTAARPSGDPAALGGGAPGDSVSVRTNVAQLVERALTNLVADRMTPRSVLTVSYHRSRARCLPRRQPDERLECDPLSDAQIELAMRLFREHDRERRDNAAAIERELLAEARRAIGLAPMRRRR
jgi:hypothetical protein